MTKFIEVKAKVKRPLSNGERKVMNETYIVDAMSVMEAETLVMNAITPLADGEAVTYAIRKSNITEIVYDTDAEQWYRAKVNYIVIDEKSGVEKKSSVYYLIEADSFEDAFKNLKESLEGIVLDYEIANISESNIIDVILK